MGQNVYAQIWAQVLILAYNVLGNGQITIFLHGIFIIWLVGIKYIFSVNYRSISRKMWIWGPKKLHKSTKSRLFQNGNFGKPASLSRKLLLGFLIFLYQSFCIVCTRDWDTLFRKSIFDLGLRSHFIPAGVKNTRVFGPQIHILLLIDL